MSWEESYKRILLYPVPVIASIDGHAFGDGTILACACDFRFMKSDKGFFCFPGVDISIPFLPGMLEIIKKAVPRYKLYDIVLSGKRTAALELELNHVITKASADETGVLKEAIAFAKTFNKRREIFGEIKKRLHKGIVEVMEKEDPAYIEPLKIVV